jgi:hypothetical protein
MITDRDIYASANIFIKRWGEDAAIDAAKRADAMLDAGDLDGRVVWMRIIKGIEQLQKAERPMDTPLH